MMLSAAPLPAANGGDYPSSGTTGWSSLPAWQGSDGLHDVCGLLRTSLCRGILLYLHLLLAMALHPRNR